MHCSTRESQVYLERPTRFLGIEVVEGWRLKLYHITALGQPATYLLLQDALKVAARVIESVPDTSDVLRLGFAGIHEGTRGTFLFVDWWADRKELHHRGFYSDAGPKFEFKPCPTSDPLGCVWDLRVIGFEAEAWARHVLTEPSSIEGYLSDVLDS